MRVIVTGVSSGIGREIAQLLLDGGHSIWGIARSDAFMNTSSNFNYSKVDLSNSYEIESWLQQMSACNFIPDVIIYNAAIYDDYLEVNSLIFYDRIMAVNTRSSIQISKFYRNLNTKHVLVSSISAKIIDWDNIFYTISKSAATNYFTYLLFVLRLDVRIIYLGPVRTSIKKNTKLNSFPFRQGAANVAHFIIGTLKKGKGIYYYPLWLRYYVAVNNLIGMRGQFIIGSRVKSI